MFIGTKNTIYEFLEPGHNDVTSRRKIKRIRTFMDSVHITAIILFNIKKKHKRH